MMEKSTKESMAPKILWAKWELPIAAEAIHLLVIKSENHTQPPMCRINGKGDESQE